MLQECGKHISELSALVYTADQECENTISDASTCLLIMWFFAFLKIPLHQFGSTFAVFMLKQQPSSQYSNPII